MLPPKSMATAVVEVGGKWLTRPTAFAAAAAAVADWLPSNIATDCGSGSGKALGRRHLCHWVWHRMMNVLIKLEPTQQAVGALGMSETHSFSSPSSPFPPLPLRTWQMLFWATGASVNSCCLLESLGPHSFTFTCNTDAHKYSLWILAIKRVETRLELVWPID